MMEIFKRRSIPGEVIIPAQPGWRIIQWYFPITGGKTLVNKGLHYDVDAVIGWGVVPGVLSIPRPICAFKPDGEYAIMDPYDGVIDYVAERTFKSITEWAHDLASRHEEAA